jgi:hypothetical protein
VARCRDRGHHVAAGRIDLVDPLLRDLVEMLAVERGAGVAAAVERARDLAAAGSIAISFAPVAAQTRRPS